MILGKPSRLTGPDPMTAIAFPRTIDHRVIAGELEEARDRTLLLLAPLSEHDLRLQHDPLMSPILWDLGHIAHFEELWLTQNLDGEIRFSEMPGMYNPFEHPRRVRDKLVYPPVEECLAVMDGIRERVAARLAGVDWSSPNP